MIRELFYDKTLEWDNIKEMSTYFWTIIIQDCTEISIKLAQLNLFIMAPL